VNVNPDGFKKLLRDRGYTEGAEGQWSKDGSASSDPTGRPPAKRLDDRPLPNKGEVEVSAIRRFVAIITIKTVRPRDFDGLGAASKYYCDALIHLGVIEDDSPIHLEVVFDPQKCDHFKQQETIIEMWEDPRT